MKIMKRNNGKVWGCALMLCALLAGGCSDDYIPSEDLSVKGGNGSAGIVLAPEEMDVVELKSPTGATVNENSIRNAWIVQYDANGTALSCQFLSNNALLELDAAKGTAQAVGVNLNSEARRIYFIANATSELFTQSTNGGPAESAVKTAAITNISGEDDLLYLVNGVNYYIPMYGYWEGTSAPEDNMTVTMKRTVAKVSFEINAELPGDDAFLLDTVLVRNVPSRQQYYLDGDGLVNSSDGTGAYPATTYVTPTQDLMQSYVHNVYNESSPNGTKWDAWNENSPNQDPYALKGDRAGILLPAPDVVQIGTYYLPENARGVSNSVTEQWEKDAEHAPGGTTTVNGKKECYATYLEIHGAYRGNGLVTDVVYKVYLGENNTTDYNVYRNHYYKVTATIKGQNRVDTRINAFEPANYLDYTDNSKPWLVMAARYHTAEAAWNSTFNTAEGWEIPTTKDLMLMWIYEAKGTRIDVKNYCWTSDVLTDRGRWGVSLNTGHTLFSEPGSSSDVTRQQLRFIKYW